MNYEDVIALAKDSGLTSGQILTLRSTGIFPRAVKKGLGRSKGFTYEYPADTPERIKQLIEWKKKTSTLVDLRWNLWLYSGWDWLFNSVKDDLIEIIHKPLNEQDLPNKSFYEGYLQNSTHKGRSKHSSDVKEWIKHFWAYTVLFSGLSFPGTLPGDKNTQTVIRYMLERGIFNLEVVYERVMNAGKDEWETVIPIIREFEQYFLKTPEIKSLRLIWGAIIPKDRQFIRVIRAALIGFALTMNNDMAEN